ncbi:hypothetical protein TSMEX_005776 [Taenia solium]|eukprot:TsM_000916700 transcript=TsM_000916700 gene=TsM_000916700
MPAGLVMGIRPPYTRAGIVTRHFGERSADGDNVLDAFFLKQNTGSNSNTEVFCIFKNTVYFS